MIGLSAVKPTGARDYSNDEGSYVVTVYHMVGESCRLRTAPIRRVYWLILLGEAARHANSNMN